MEHYVCTGNCGGVSEIPTSCQTKNCTKYKKRYKKCYCYSKKHLDALEKEIYREINGD